MLIPLKMILMNFVVLTNVFPGNKEPLPPLLYLFGEKGVSEDHKSLFWGLWGVPFLKLLFLSQKFCFWW